MQSNENVEIFKCLCTSFEDPSYNPFYYKIIQLFVEYISEKDAFWFLITDKFLCTLQQCTDVGKAFDVIMSLDFSPNSEFVDQLRQYTNGNIFSGDVETLERWIANHPVSPPVIEPEELVALNYQDQLAERRLKREASDESDDKTSEQIWQESLKRYDTENALEHATSELVLQKVEYDEKLSNMGKLLAKAQQTISQLETDLCDQKSKNSKKSYKIAALRGCEIENQLLRAKMDELKQIHKTEVQALTNMMKIYQDRCIELEMDLVDFRKLKQTLKDVVQGMETTKN